jgi:thiosulfate/3-mercaptopyruvate sulfurtransferase
MSMGDGKEALVSTDWLARHLGSPDLRIADATWFLPTAGRDARAEYARQHIAGAVYFDIDDIADERSAYKHTVPSAEKFASRVQALGLGDGVKIVVYDNNRFSASARAWWLFRLFGHPDVAVLDGGLAKWLAEGRPVTDEPTQPRERPFTARRDDRLLRELDQMRANVGAKQDQVVDVRSAGRFHATEPEPRAGLRGGHMPGSVNLPYPELLRADGTMRPPEELEAAFAAAGVEHGRPIVTSCGSGVTAAIGTLALYLLGEPSAAVYDGSWTEWASQPDTPVTK